MGQFGRRVWAERDTDYGHASEWSVWLHSCLQPKLPLLYLLQTGQWNRVSDRLSLEECKENSLLIEALSSEYSQKHQAV